MNLNFIFYQKLFFLIVPFFVIGILHRSVYDALVLYGLLEVVVNLSYLLTLVTIKLAMRTR